MSEQPAGPPGPRPEQPTPQPAPLLGPAATPPDPAAAKRASRLSLRFVLLLLATMLCAGLPVPWQLASLATVTGALVVGGMAIHATWLAGRRGGAIPVLAAAMALALVTGVSLIGSLAFWDEQVERQRCLTAAVTISAREACDARYAQQITARLDRLTGTLTGPG